MNAYDIKQTKNLTPLTKEETEYIFNLGIITGSYAFGEYTKGISDINILLYNFYIQKIKKYETKIYIPDYNNKYDNIDITICYALSHEKISLNLLIFKDKNEFKLWKKTTEVMKKINEIPFINKKVINDRSRRIKIFSYIREEILRKI